MRCTTPGGKLVVSAALPEIGSTAVFPARKLAGPAQRSGDAASETCAGWIQETEEVFRAALDDDLDYPRALDAVIARVQGLEPEQVGNARHALERIVRPVSILSGLSRNSGRQR